MKISLADSWFSKFIRLRDADYSGYIYCITCNRRVFWKDSDCGHCVKRQHQMTRFNEKNCGAQCKSCNYFEQGKTVEHENYIINIYGQQVFDLLKSDEKKSCKRSKLDLKLLSEYYKEKAIELALIKGIKLIK